MARTSFKLQLREVLRFFPFPHRAVKASGEIIRNFFTELLRSIGPKNRTLGLPQGFYSGYHLVRQGLCEGEIIHESQYCPFFPAGSLLKKSGLGQDSYQPWPIFWMRIPEAILTGRSLVPIDLKGNLLAEATFSKLGDQTDPAFQNFALGFGKFIEGNATSIVSRWGGDAHGNRRYGGAGYWHWLLDSVARLSLLEHFPSDTKVITPPLVPWMRWYLEHLDLGGRILETEATSLRVENFYFSSPSSMTGCWNPHAINFLRQKFLSLGSPPSDSFPKRFYIIREGYTRKITNESEVRELFADRGWALIAPEKLSIPDQIALFRDAEAIAGLHGSALTNILWSSSKTSVFELTPENFMAGAFEWLAKYNELNHHFLVCPVNQKGQTIIRIKDLDSQLKDLCSFL